MKIDQLTYFIETAKTQHIGRASQVLHVSPSAISHSIAALEEELGTALFEKNGKNILLTEKGRVFLERVEPLLMGLDELKMDMGHREVAFRGFYKLAGGHQLMPKLVAPVCFELQEKHPELKFELQTFRSALVLEEVLHRRVDLGICYSPQEHPDLSYRALSTGNMYVVVRKNHPILKKRLQDRVEILNSLTCVMAKPSQGIQVCETHPVFREHGIELNISAVCDNYEVALEKIKRSDTWGFLPEWCLDKEVLPVKVSSRWNAKYSISAIWHRKMPLGRGLEEVLKRIEKRLS